MFKPATTFFTAPILISAVACSDQAPAPSAQIDGGWNINSSISEASQRCTLNGTLVIAQDVDVLSGSYTLSRNCTRQTEIAASASQQIAGTISRGRVVEDNIHFEIDQCRYSGSVSDDQSETLNGTILCTYISRKAEISTESGSWFADKIAD